MFASHGSHLRLTAEIGRGKFRSDFFHDEYVSAGPLVALGAEAFTKPQSEKLFLTRNQRYTAKRPTLVPGSDRMKGPL